MRALQVLTMALALATTPAAALPNWQLSNTDHMIVLRGRSDESVMAALKQVDTVIVERGDGGSVSGMFDSLEYLRANPNKRVVINGACYSACTLLLTVPQQVTYTDQAEFYFHSAARSSCKGTELVRTISEDGNTHMREAFDSKMRRWIARSKAYGSLNFTKLGTGDLRRMLPHMRMTNSRMIHYDTTTPIMDPTTSSLFPTCTG